MAKVEAVSKMARTSNQVWASKFLGLASYCRCFIQDFTSIAAPLHQLFTVGNEKHLLWREACHWAFLELTECLSRAPVLSHPTFDKEYILDTDVSDFRIGAIPSQVHGGRVKVMAYTSWMLSKLEKKLFHYQERNVGTRVLFTVLQTLSLWVEIHCKNWPCCIMLADQFQGTNWTNSLFCWLERLAEFDFKVQAHPNKRYGNVDVLSRRPQEPDGAVSKELPTNWCTDWKTS